MAACRTECLGYSLVTSSIDPGTLCLACSPVPGPAQASPLAGWDTQTKLLEAARRASPLVPAEMRGDFAAMLSPANIAITLAFLGGAAAAQFVPVGGQILTAGFLVAGIFLMGRSIVEFGRELRRFSRAASNATSDAQLDEAAQHLARAIALVGVTAAVALVMKGAGKLRPATNVPRMGGTAAILDGDAVAGGVGGSPKNLPTGAMRGLLRGTRLLGPRYYKGWPDLPAEAAATFAEAEPEFVQPGEKLYRVFGGKARANGAFWSRNRMLAESTWRSELAVRDGWNSALEELEVTAGPKGLKVWRGPTAPQYVEDGFNGPRLDDIFYKGGGEQIYFPLGQFGSTTAVRPLR